MTIVLQNATLSGNTATAEDTANLLSFTKVMLRTDQDFGSDMDFDFKTSEPTTAEETYLNIKLEDALITSWSTSASETGGNDGVVDAADYVVWRKGGGLDTVDIDLSLSAAVDTGVPVSMPEYGLFLF